MRASNIARMIDASLGNDLFRHSTKSNVVMLTYHGLVRDDDTLSAWTFVPESAFVRQMEYVAERFEVVSLRDAVANPGRKTSKKRAVITFDDGYASNHDIAFPILKRFGMPATIFVTTGFIETGAPFWYDKVVAAAQMTHTDEIDLTTWGLKRMHIPRASDVEARWVGIQKVLDQLKELTGPQREEIAEALLHRYGVGTPTLTAFQPLTPEMMRTMQESGLIHIGSHTHGHEILTQLDNQATLATLAKSTDLLTKWLGTQPVEFAYPNGDYSPDVINCVRASGYACAVTTEYDEWKGTGDVYAIPRVAIGAFDDSETFALKVSGFNSVFARVSRFFGKRTPGFKD